MCSEKMLKTKSSKKGYRSYAYNTQLEELQSMRHNDSDKKESAQLAKRHKEEIQRKDQALKHYKQKVEEKSAEVEVVKHDHVQKYSTSVHELGILVALNCRARTTQIRPTQSPAEEARNSRQYVAVPAEEALQRKLHPTSTGQANHLK